MSGYRSISAVPNLGTYECYSRQEDTSLFGKQTMALLIKSPRRKESRPITAIDTYFDPTLSCFHKAVVIVTDGYLNDETAVSKH